MTDVWIITGKQNSGKTVMLLDLLKLILNNEISICGLVSPGVYENNERIAIQVLDIESGERAILADLKQGWTPNNPVKKWKMREETIDWGDEHLQKMDPKGKIFFLDEIGIYELLDKKGWQTGLKILREKAYTYAVIAVRKDVLSEVIKICEKARISVEIIDLDVLVKSKQEITQAISKELLQEQ